jgi:hypothetical protein
LKKTFSLLLLLFLAAAFSFAQEFGSIKGTVADPEGVPLPGVTVTLTGSKTAPRTVITSEHGNFRFLNLPVASDYTVKFELVGFKSIIREKQVVSYGRDVILDVTMEPAKLEESITVVGETPVIDTKRTQVGVNITEDMIMSLPTSRNPWVMLALAPGVMIDREDVGGSDAGQQSAYYGHGSSGNDNTWNIDGANITDYSALGAAPTYVNLASYEELQINYGNNDIRSQTGGVQLNFVSKRGGNVFSGTFYLDAEDKNWQSENITQELKDAGYKGAGINKVYLYGATFGGPIIKDHAWFMGSWGIQDIGTSTLAGTTDNTWLQSGYARLDFQLTNSTRSNVFLEYDSKLKWGRTAWGATLQSADTVWNQTGPTYIWKGEVEQMFGNLFLNAKVIYSHNVFYLTPVLGKRDDQAADAAYLWRQYDPYFYVTGNIDDYGTVRPTFNVNLNGNYFAEGILGGNHEIKFGVDYLQSTVSSFDLYTGQVEIADYGGGWVEAWLHRDFWINLWLARYSAFIQDTISFGKFALNLGVRYDVEQSKVKNEHQPACLWLPGFLPDVSVTEYDPGVKWQTFSPRISLIYDITGNGKNVIKLNAARYSSQSGYDMAYFVNPVGWSEIDLRWVDANSDGRVTSNELHGTDWNTGDPTVSPLDPDGWSWYSGFDPANPAQPVAVNKIDPNYNSPWLDELSVSFEREIITDFAARLEVFYKRRHNFAWNQGILNLATGQIETQSNWDANLATPAIDPAGHDATVNADWWTRRVRAAGTYRTLDTKNYEQYIAAEIVLKKRLSKRWMMDGSFTWLDWTWNYNGIGFDPTNRNYSNGGVNAPQSGGSGITDVYVNSRWMSKMSALYQFPYGINGSFTFVGRDGYVIPQFVQINRARVGWINLDDQRTGTEKFGDFRLPAFFELNLRIEKVFNISETSTVTVAADAFNALNANTSLSKAGDLNATDYNQTKRIINPRVFRFGIRFNF